MVVHTLESGPRPLCVQERRGQGPCPLSPDREIRGGLVILAATENHHVRLTCGPGMSHLPTPGVLSLILEWQVHAGPAVAAIHDAVQCHPLREGLDQGIPHRVVLDHAAGCVVQGHQRLGLMVRLVARVARGMRAMPRVREPQGIPWGCPHHQGPHRRQHVVAGWLVGGVIRHLRHGEALLLEPLCDMFGIVDAPVQFTFHATIIDANDQGLLFASRPVWGPMDDRLAARGKQIRSGQERVLRQQSSRDCPGAPNRVGLLEDLLLLVVLWGLPCQTEH
mmetsp:Transcript_25017/g.39546  ORF Transcript_25017/g.39546 Transcript_25017/m.39546 type:complete len:278 (+) Transcript_25017:1041-1874(+)